MNILPSNLKGALEIAIEHQSHYERTVLKYTMDSSCVAGWRQVLEAINRGERITVEDKQRCSCGMLVSKSVSKKLLEEVSRHA